MAEHGIDCAEKTARQLTRSDHNKSDLLIGMDRANLWNICRPRGSGLGGETCLLIYYTSHPGDVADLWYTDRLENHLRVCRRAAPICQDIINWREKYADQLQ